MCPPQAAEQAVPSFGDNHSQRQEWLHFTLSLQHPNVSQGMQSWPCHTTCLHTGSELQQPFAASSKCTTQKSLAAFLKGRGVAETSASEIQVLQPSLLGAAAAAELFSYQGQGTKTVS